MFRDPLRSAEKSGCTDEDAYRAHLMQYLVGLLLSCNPAEDAAVLKGRGNILNSLGSITMCLSINYVPKHLLSPVSCWPAAARRAHTLSHMA